MFNKKQKKGISPLIATVLIIGFTIVLAALVITWGTKLFKTTVGETETTSKFSLACTTGLRLDATPKAFAGGNNLDVDLRNNNQDRTIGNFQFILYDSLGGVKRFNALGSGDGQFSVLIGGSPDVDPENIKLDFPVPKTYRLIASSGIDLTLITKLEVYPIMTIDGTTKNCESPVTVNLV